MDRAEPYDIPKREVWEAYKRVRANQGAAGVDGQMISDFEADLANNLYKLWNRLSSGSYFPPPVRRVDIPKSAIRGWINYYGRFCPSALYPTLRLIDLTLARWASGKFKSLRGHKRRSRHWLARIAPHHPRLVGHRGPV